MSIFVEVTPVFLEEVAKTESGPRGDLIRQMKEAGLPVPGVMQLFEYRHERNVHLSRFTQGVMRGPSALSAGQRELIAAFVSRRNECRF